MIELHITDMGVINTVYTNTGQITARITYTTENNLPKPIQTKLAILKLMAIADDIPDVGQKVSNTVYWIYEGDLSEPVITNLMNMYIILRGIRMKIAPIGRLQ